MAFKIGNNGDSEEILSEINMTPLIDIMLVLLIIFMVTSSISLESGLDIDIPKTTSSTTPNEGNAIVVSLDKSGNIFVQGNKAKFDSLKESISEAIKANNSKLVVFEGDQKSEFGMAIKIMDIAKSAGASKFAIAAEGN